MKAKMDYIRGALPREELLAQLAEEACELGHAALKLRRALDGTNPTPVSVEDAEAALCEEVADTMLLLVLCVDDLMAEFVDGSFWKLYRWEDRLKAAERGDTHEGG